MFFVVFEYLTKLKNNTNVVIKIKRENFMVTLDHHEVL